MMKIAVIGGGNSGLAMCAYLSAHGHSVTLWNRTIANIAEIKKTSKISCTGVIEGSFHVELVTDNISKAIENCNIIFITIPANGHSDIANLLAPCVKKNQTIILHPGRTFGGIEVLNIISQHSNQNIPKIAETQTIVFTCRKTTNSSVVILELKKDVMLAGINCEAQDIINEIPNCLRNNYIAEKSFIKTSLGNVGMLLHVAPVLLNIGWIEWGKINFKYYYSGITPSIASLIEKIDKERCNVAKAYGVEIETLKDWLRKSYGVYGVSLYELIHNVESYKYIDAPDTLNHRYLYEDIPTGLVALEAAGKNKNIKTPITSMLIDLANQIRDFNFREIGRTEELIKKYLK